MTDLQPQAAAQNAWAIETYHRNLKQFAAVERGQFRLEVSQRNPSASQFVLFCALKSIVFTSPSPARRQTVHHSTGHSPLSAPSIHRSSVNCLTSKIIAG